MTKAYSFIQGNPFRKGIGKDIDHTLAIHVNNLTFKSSHKAEFTTSP